MKRLEMDTKGCVQLTSNETYFADIWFISVETDKEEMTAGVDYCGPAKMIHKGFCLSTLEKLIKDFPGGSYLVMKITTRANIVRPLLAIGYKYNYRNVLGFIATEGDGSTEPGGTYLSHFHDIILIFLFTQLFVLNF